MSTALTKSSCATALPLPLPLVVAEVAEVAELEPWIKSYDERALHVAAADEVTAAGRAAQKRERLMTDCKGSPRSCTRWR